MMSNALASSYITVNPDELIPGSVWFRWREALYLKKMDLIVYPTKFQYQKIIIHAKNFMDPIRNFLGRPINVHSWLRPQLYNDFVDGAHLSAHIEGIAVDFEVVMMKCDEVREALFPKLDRWNIRMEDNPGSNWVHVDSRDPGPSGRFFKPTRKIENVNS